MTSETDHPRQRTVAELLAQHGDGATSGRRRRRRAADGPDDAEAPQGYPPAGPAPQSYEPRRAAPPTPPANGYAPANDYAPSNDYAPGNGYSANGHGSNGNGSNGRAANGYGTNGYGTNGYGSNGHTSNGHRSSDYGSNDYGSKDYGSSDYGSNDYGSKDYGPSDYGSNDVPPSVPDRSVLREPVPRDLPGDVPPRRSREGRRAADAAAPPFTGRAPIQQQPAPRETPTDQIPRFRSDAQQPSGRNAIPPRHQEPPPARPQDSGSNTLVGVPPRGTEAWHESRTSRRRGVADEGGPPTQAGRPLDLEDRPAGLDGDDDEVAVDGRRGGRYAEYDDDVDYDDEFEDDEYDDEYDEDDDEGENTAERPAGRRDRIAAMVTGQGWPAVVAQWVVGAIGGATLWVLFRFLWRDLPVVAIAAAVLVTVGLVVVVRNLLRSNDMRTTIFAVLVGLLLTVSPVILILLGR